MEERSAFALCVRMRRPTCPVELGNVGPYLIPGDRARSDDVPDLFRLHGSSSVDASVTGMPSSDDLYTAPASKITYELVRQFVLDAEAANLFSESLTFEAKESRNGINIAKAVAALSNTDGGIILEGVKDKDATGEARIVGVPKTELGSLVSTLRSQIPEAIPEIVPVRIPGTEKLILVLRVHADEVPHPVMVNGTIYYRVPEQSVPADRQRVHALVARDRDDSDSKSAKLEVLSEPWDPGQEPLWPGEPTVSGDSNPHSAILQVTGGIRLPRRILDRPWLDSRARQASLDMLNNSPLRNSDWSTRPWEITNARAARVRLNAGCTGRGMYRADAAACLNLDGRKLSMLFALRWVKQDGHAYTLSPEGLYCALLGTLITISSVCRHVAKAIDAAEPAEQDSWDGLLICSPSYFLHQAIDLKRFRRDASGSGDKEKFPTAWAQGPEIEHLDELARNWITYWLLELGIRDFETWFAAQERPNDHQ